MVCRLDYDKLVPNMFISTRSRIARVHGATGGKHHQETAPHDGQAQRRW